MLRPEKMRRVSSPDRNVFDEVLVLIDEPPFVGVAEPLDLWAIVERGEICETEEMGNGPRNCPRRWQRRTRRIGVGVLKEYKDQLFIWWRSSSWLVFPE